MMSSLFIGATGLKSHGEGMAVIGHNLANVNTVGYKQISMEFADLVSQYVTASSANMTNINQKGSGARPLDTRTLFTQGGIELGSAATDLCINGIGFFGVTQNNKTYYTRAGDFRFTKDGELVDPSGWNVLGRAIVNGAEATATTPIVLDTTAAGVGYMAPLATSKITNCSNLAGLEDKSADPANPFFAMAANWDGTQSPPLGQNSYSYSEPIQFYDSTGVLRSATIYYDSAGKSGGMNAVEYLIALDPSQNGSGGAGTETTGLLMAGTMTFSANGDLARLTAFSPPASGSPADLTAWTPAPIVNGQPAFTAQIAGGGSQQIAFDTGYTFAQGASASGGLASAADAAASSTLIFSTDTTRTLSARSSVALGESPSAIYASRDGYGEGWLRDLHVRADGIVEGSYTNNQSQDLYRVVLYRFPSQDGLRHEGNNHFSATPESGSPEEGIPGDENFGTLSEYSLEQSNVDYAREFSRLIITQRGFQMNSKVITTSDTMLQRALELKR